ncbi:MAG: DUF11 domain-containing protein, partial [Candidatus Electrothrix sp. ATG2]|nr:DUF11 domain-containing protein [Candidatus Electrothrix sp. ATG2]
MLERRCFSQFFFGGSRVGYNILNNGHVFFSCQRQSVIFGLFAALFFLLSAGEAFLFPFLSYADSDICYTVSDSDAQGGGDDSLGLLNRVPVPNAVWFSIGLTTTWDIEAIALDLAGETLYAANGGKLGTLDTATGAYTVIGSFGSGDGAKGTQTFADVDGLTFDPLTGYFYGTSRVEGTDGLDLLFRIDPTTGQSVPDAFGAGVDYVEVDTSGLYDYLNDIDDIAIDPLTGQMYGVANRAGKFDHLVKIDKYTGAVEDIGVFELDGVRFTDVEGLGFYNDGRFYATTGAGGTIADSFFDIRLSDASMRKIKDIGLSSNGNGDYEAVACLSGGVNHITGTVFFDNDLEGDLDTGDAGIAGVTVELFLDVNGNGNVDPEDVLIQTQITDSEGFYDFTVAAPGPFVLRVNLDTVPDNHFFTTDNLETAVFPLPPGGGEMFGLTDPNNNFGLGITEGENTITGTVFEDSGALPNGDLDEGENGRTPGVMVYLYEDNNNDNKVDSGDNLIASVPCNPDGTYIFKHLGINNYVLMIEGNDLPAGTVQTTNAPDYTRQADFSSYGNIDPDNDFGYIAKPVNLEVTKESSATQPVTAGETIEYSISITNNSSAAVHDIVVDDFLPDGTTYVAASTKSYLVETFADDFRTGDFSGNQGSQDFLYNWEEIDEGGTGDNINFFNDNECVTPGDYCLSIEAEEASPDDMITRRADLSAYNEAVLSYDYRIEDDLASGVIVFEISTDGSSWTELARYTGTHSDVASESFDISSYLSAVNTDTRFRFRVETELNNNSTLRIDNFRIVGKRDMKDNDPSNSITDLTNGIPSIMVTADDDYDLEVNQTMEIVYSVTVNSLPLPLEIVNIVKVTSADTTMPLYASVTDPVVLIASYAVVSSFKAYIDGKNKTVLEWETSSEIGTIGFYLERLNEQSGKYQTVTKKLLPGMLSPPHGGTYRYI